MIEVDLTLKYLNKDSEVKKSHFEIVYAAVVKIDEAYKRKKRVRKNYIM